MERALKIALGKIKEGEAPNLCNLPGASKALVIKEITDQLLKAKTTLLIYPTEQGARLISEDLKRLGKKTLYLPPWDTPPLDPSSPLAERQYSRLKTLYQLIDSPPEILVLTPESLIQKVLPPDILLELSIELRVGEEIELSKLPRKIAELGYKRVDSEPEIGEFAVLGDTVHLVTPEEERVEISFFDDEVEEIKVNREKRKELILVPILELPPVEELLKPLKEKYPELVERHFLLGELSGCEKLLPEVFELTPITDYLDQAPKAIIVEPERVRLAKENFIKTINENYEILQSEGIPSSPPGEFISETEIPVICFIYERKVKEGIDFNFSPLPPISEENLKELIPALSGLKVTVIYKSEEIRREIEKYGLNAAYFKGESLGGFKYTQDKIAWVTEENYTFETPKRDNIYSFEEGEIVVHRDYGIGIFRGIVSREINGKRYDFVEIEYAGGEKLYAPFTQIDRIFRYGGYKGKTPKLDRLGGTSWKNLERRIKASLTNFAKELAELYKERKSALTEKLTGDPRLLEEFEKRFKYKLTPDQKRAIKEVYKDLESEKPMDRLICGDVGFGKTEVAMRAAMKVVSSGKQVAVIAPTTVLADQHYRTFKKRFQDFPVEIELLSRFRSKKEQKEIIEKLRKGEIDIIIGTHRLLQDDVKFKDLGLLIIDEEHRFGVKTKEKLTQLKKNLNVMYLSATPIPRTLYSALSGFRDISLIETPPPGRRGTKVVVTKYSDKVLKGAIERELKRGGQVFVVFNDISQLPILKEKIANLFPESRVEIVHGQMKPSQIEKVMHSFFEGEIDILISTSIVESGLDVPSANTLIVIGAENFGLSQLYQLKGRVGRGVEKGYCYLLISPKAKLTQEASKRLEAIRRISPLGGGFQLALKDLEIRGAGTLLGPKQSGFVESIGLELYTKLLQEVVEEKSEEEDVKLNLPFEAFIPDDFVSDRKEKIKLYSQLASSKDPKEFLEELKKVKGFIPDPIVNLLETMELKKLARELGIKEISMGQSGRVMVVFGKEPKASPEKLVKLVQEKGAILTPDGKLFFSARTLEEIKNTLKEIRDEEKTTSSSS